MLDSSTILLIIIVIVSIQSWNKSTLLNKLVFSPYKVSNENEWYRFITSGFVHADYGHLIFNSLSLYFFSSNLLNAFKSDYLFGAYGDFAFISLFILGVIISDVPSYIKFKNDPYYSSLGASGGVSSVIFASIFIFPTSKISLLFIPIGIPAFLFGILYLTYCYYMAEKSHDRINHSAHFIGSLFGILFLALIKPSLIQDFIESIKLWSL